MTERAKRNFIDQLPKWIPSLAVIIAMLMTGGWKVNVDRGIERNAEINVLQDEKDALIDDCMSDLLVTVRVRGERIEALERRIDELTEADDLQDEILIRIYEHQTGRIWGVNYEE